ncbi:hypothetical protein QBC43DRAFT_256944 [Cladorrhinum sp. PSN259]|nr:hypothetical protein QBC43DRAFT_256944 [Cladorrhinum sp. PSN259]
MQHTHQQHQQQPQQHQHYSSSPSLSSPPSAIGSEPTSPTRVINAGRANIEMDEIIVDPSSAARFGIMQTQQSSEHPPGVQLTAAGIPRKKPGRKPGSTVKPKTNPDGTAVAEAPKQRRPRKPKDPNAPPIQRKRKAATGDGNETNSEMDARAASGPPPPSAPAAVSAAPAAPARLTSMRMSLDAQPGPAKAGFVQAPKRESTGSMQMQSLLNDDPPPKPAAPARQMFDPIRGNYDPVRETMVTRDPYGTGSLGSPRAPTTTQVVNRASASPSIASLVDPTPSLISPRQSQAYPATTTATTTTTTTSQARFQEVVSSVPPSPSNNIRSAATAPTTPSMPKPVLAEVRRPPPPPPTPAAATPTPAATTTTTAAAKQQPQEVKMNSFTSMSTIPSSSAAASAIAAPPAPVQSKKIAAVVQQDRREASAAKKARSNASSPKINSLKDGKDSGLPPLPGGSDRSILDFGRAKPGEEVEAPSISLHIPLRAGENNKYVNFMRMAEERYGWDALHPRLAASRERKARIEAATLALEKEKNGRESGDDEMEEDLQSDADNSNVEMGGMNPPNLSGPEAPVVPAKPARKKRNFKEDEYDKDDDFVDDSEMLWEEQAAASRDGFFVYSGPLIPEVEKPLVPEGPAKRGRRGGGRGSRGAAGAAESSATPATATTTTTTTARGRGGGPGSRGGTVRKPRITKLEKEQRDREKVEREKLALLAKGVGIGGPGAPNGMSGLLSAPPSAAAGGVAL